MTLTLFVPSVRANVQETSDLTAIGVRVLLVGELRRLAGRREVNLELPERSTIHDLSRALGAACDPAFADRVLTPDGDLQSHVAVFLNGEQLAEGRDGPTCLSAGDVELMLLPMFEGG